MARSLEELVERWEQIAKHAATYNLTLDDWLNDLDLRDIIGRRIAEMERAVGSALQSRLAAADRAFREATRESQHSLWGSNSGVHHDRTRQWWYFRYPVSPGADLRADLELS